MSDLNKFALEVASLLDKIANSEPETASVPGAPFHMAVHEMGKTAKKRLEQMRHQAKLEKVGFDPVTLGLGALGAGGLGLYKAMPAIERFFGGRMAQRAAQTGARAVQEGAEALGPRAFAEQGLARLQMHNPAQFEEVVRTLPGVEAFYGAEAQKSLAEQAKQLAAAEQGRLMALGGAGLAGMGGLLAGSRMSSPDNRNNLPQIVRYG